MLEHIKLYNEKNTKSFQTLFVDLGMHFYEQLWSRNNVFHWGKHHPYNNIVNDGSDGVDRDRW